jgi:hypothetical protein
MPEYMFPIFSTVLKCSALSAITIYIYTYIYIYIYINYMFLVFFIFPYMYFYPNIDVVCPLFLCSFRVCGVVCGCSSSRVRDLFEKAKAKALCIVFIDEIDAQGRQRGLGLDGGNDEREHTINQFLTEMDGFSGNSGVIVLAATNRPDVLDSALLRPGRFDRRVTVYRPDVTGRVKLLQVCSTLYSLYN